VVCSR